MRIEELLANRTNETAPIGDEQFKRLRSYFFFNVPIIEKPDGSIHNPVDEKDKALFEKFLDEAGRRNEIFNPTYQHYAN
jgi:hypothetical protein